MGYVATDHAEVPLRKVWHVHALGQEDRRTLSAPYSSLDETSAVWNALDYSPENHRRLRALSAWRALRAARRAGYQDIAEQSLHNAATFDAWVKDLPQLELLAPAHFNTV